MYMGVSFRKPEDTYRVDLKARLDELEKKIQGVSSSFSRKGNATATNTTDLNTALKELGTRVNRGVSSNAYSIQRLEKTLEKLMRKSVMRSSNNNRSLIGFQLELQNFEDDVLSFLEKLTIDQNSDKRLKQWRKLKTKQRTTGEEGRLPSFKF
jgi:hypothetical protein